MERGFKSFHHLDCLPAYIDFFPTPFMDGCFSSGCYNKNIKLDAWNSKNLCLIIWEAGASKVKAPADSMPSEILLPSSQTAVYLFTLAGCGGRSKGALRDLFY